MSTAHALNGHHGPSQPACPAGPDTVKNPLTPGRAGRAVENDEYAAFVLRADFRAWERQLATETTCSHPIQLRSRTDMIDLGTGELAPLYGEVSVACGNRREAVCRACSAVYKRDARQLVRAGPAGGKGIPRDDHRPSVCVRYPHGPFVRAGSVPPDARQDRAAVPSPPRRHRAPLPAWPRLLLPDPPRRD